MLSAMPQFIRLNDLNAGLEVEPALYGVVYKLKSKSWKVWPPLERRETAQGSRLFPFHSSALAVPILDADGWGGGGKREKTKNRSPVF